MYVLLLVFIISWLYVIGETRVNFNRRDNIVYLSKKESAHLFANDPKIVSYIAGQRKVEKPPKVFPIISQRILKYMVIILKISHQQKRVISICY